MFNLTVPKNQVFNVDGTQTYLVEASDLGLVPGEWPDSVTLTEPNNPDIVLERNTQVQKGGWSYVSKEWLGVRLEILND